MITSISLKNFKAFQELRDIKTKPITIFCGSNSCGKSSILQSILLLKQSLETRNPNHLIATNGRFVHLGAFENIIYKRNTDNNVVFQFSFSVSKQDISERRLGNRTSFIEKFFEEILGPNYKRSNKFTLNYSLSMKADLSHDLYKGVRPVNLEELEISFDVNIQGVLPISVSLKHIDGKKYNIIWENVLGKKFSNRGEFTAEVEFNSLLPVSFAIAVTLETIENLDVKTSETPAYLLSRLSDCVRNFFTTFSYIGPLREEPSRRYIYENDVMEIGAKGENAAYLYYTEQDKQIKKHFYFNKKTESFEKRDKLTLKEAVNDWLSLMNIKEFKPEISNELIYLRLNANSNEDTRVTIADVGFGVSQIFPIILEGFRISKGHTLLLEQPEIHLHPKLQMQMADYFISLAMSGKSLMIETHSDHIINRLVRRIVEDQTNNLNDLIEIYFITETSEGPKIEEIMVDESRGIINWPMDFFDQNASEQEKIIQAGIKKRALYKGKRCHINEHLT